MTQEEKELFDKINTKIDEIYRRLFIDNSEPSFQTRIDRNTRWITGVTWAIGIIYTAVISTIVWMFKND